MTDTCKERLMAGVRDFHLPRYYQIPSVGLYLEQVTRYISDMLAPIQENCITNSMVSNYVKKKLISNPHKKQYDRDQIACLIFIAAAKSVLSLDDLKQMIELQRQTYPTQWAYDYFCEELEGTLAFVFGLRQNSTEIDSDPFDEKTMLRSVVIALSYKTYLEKYLAVIKEEGVPGQDPADIVPAHNEKSGAFARDQKEEAQTPDCVEAQTKIP
ncbi:MAG: DUF1836 domain-containing protein [Lachnospiraceae bacterium]|nr:DUF1836 domain-containing protein [Lachnospiraceae bacterium]